MTHTKEITGKRSLNFSNWIRNNRPEDVAGLTVNDVDFIFRNYRTKEIIVIEEKCYSGKVMDKHRPFYNDIHEILKFGCEATGWSYKGYHLVQFENTCPDDGRIFFDHKEITKEQLIDIIYRFKL